MVVSCDVGAWMGGVVEVTGMVVPEGRVEAFGATSEVHDLEWTECLRDSKVA